MSDVKTATISGNLGRDPELKYTKNGKPYLSFSLASSKSWKTKNNDWETRTEWVSVVVWGKFAEYLDGVDTLAKGAKVVVVGEPSARAWIGKDGEAHAEMTLNAREVIVPSASNHSRDDDDDEEEEDEDEYTSPWNV